MQLLNKHIDGSPSDSVYIGRGSTFGNLKVIGKDGTREEVITWYKGWLKDKLVKRDPEVEKAFRSLNADSKLLCFCHPKPCHGQVIIDYWEAMSKANSYEDGIKLLGGSSDITHDTYKAWLIDKLISRDPEVSRDFRLLELSYALIPEPYRSIKELTTKVIIPLYRRLIKSGDYDIELRKLAEEYGKMPAYSPLTDGLDHINVYSKGRTYLGKVLTNFSNIGFTHPTYGKFASVEGFWYWLGTGKIHDELKDLYGFEAKEAGRKLPKIDIKNFEQEIKKAILLKVEQSEELQNQLKATELPFTHYYYYGQPENCKIIAHDDAKWFVDYLELVRKYVRGQAQKLIIAGSRGIADYATLKEAYEKSGFVPVMIVSGGAKGVDLLGEDLANELKLPIQRFIPDWDTEGKKAGMLRNFIMGDYANAAICLWDEKSPGTLSMINYMKRIGKPVFVVTVPSTVQQENTTPS